MAMSPLTGVAVALYNALYPLKSALSSPAGFMRLLSELGWRPNLHEAMELLFDEAGVSDTYSEFADIVNDIQSALSQSEATVTSILDGGDIEASEIMGLIASYRDIIDQLQNVRVTGPGAITLPTGLDLDPLWESLTEELPDYLLARYVAVHQPKLYSLLFTLGLVEEYRITPVDVPFREPYLRREIRFDYFADFMSDPFQHIQEIYRWNGAHKADDPNTFLDAWRVMGVLQDVFEQIGLRSNVTPLSDALSERHIGTPVPPPAVRPPQLTVPLVDAVHENAAVDLALELATVPQAPVTFSDPLDGAPTPYPDVDSFLLTHRTMGSAGFSFAPTETLMLTVEGNLDASHQLNLMLTPSGLLFEADPGVSYSLNATLGTTNTQPWLLAGAEGGTRLTLGGANVGAGLVGDTSGENSISLNAGFQDLEVVLAAGEGDGLLNKLLGAAELSANFDVSVLFSNTDGLKFQGSGGIEAIIPIDKSIGPVTLGSIEISLGPQDEGVRLTAVMSAEMTVGPLYAAVEQIGVYVQADIADDNKGMVGPFDLGVGFQPPTGYAVSLNADPITGGGYVSVTETEYRGALALAFEKIGFSAFAILTTEFPDGEEGYSFAGSIFAEFSVPLAYGFFLTGLGGFIGVNRTLDTDAMRDVLYAGRLDDLLFPSDPIGSASQILDDMAAIMPPMQGQHIIGPCARISWGQPNLIDITLGVMLEIGDEFRLVILGGLAMILPDEDKVLVALNLQFMGEIDFAAGTISFDATLEGSRVLTFAIDGDIAIRTGWKSGIEHIASFGGLHPDYPQPANLPDLARLSISFGGNNPRLTLSAYFTTTMNSLQFGARADMYARGPDVRFVGQVAAEGFIAFDALIYFNPFSFQVSLRGGISLLVDGDVKAGLFFALSLRGPNTYVINGEVWVKVCGIKVKFGVTHTWGQRESLPTVTADGADLLRQALLDAPGFEPDAGSDRDLAVSFRSDPDVAGTIDPLGRLRLTQSTAPLDIALEKFGEADIVGAQRLDVVVRRGGVDQPSQRVDAGFVRGHFFAISEAERLRAPSLETHKAGVSIGAETALAATGNALNETYDYEVVVIPMDETEGGGVLFEIARDVSEQTLSRFAQSEGLLLRTPDAAIIQGAINAVTDRPVRNGTQYIVTDALGLVDDTISAGTLTSANQSAQTQDTNLSAVASYVSETL